MWRLSVLAGLLALTGCSGRSVEPRSKIASYTAWPEPRGFPVRNVKLSFAPAFRLDPGKPYRIELGRGSGREGLNTVKITHDGVVSLYELEQNEDVGIWWRATIQLPAEALAGVREAAEDPDLMRLEKRYGAGAHDGMQWVLWIKQGDQEKSVCCDSHFPEPIVRFAKRLEAILVRHGVNLKWVEVPRSEDRAHENDLWDSIKR